MLLLNYQGVSQIDEDLTLYINFENTIVDSSLLINNLDITNVELSEDNFGNLNSAAYFDGSNSMIRIDDNEIISSNQMSIVSNFYYEGTKGSEQSSCIINKYSWFNGERNFRIVCVDSTISAVVHYGENSNDAIGISSPISLFEWHQFVLSISEDNIVKFYIDGCLIDSVEMPNPMQLSEEPIIIGNTILGGDAPGNNHHFNGRIDEIKIYKKEIEEEDIDWAILKPTSTTESSLNDNVKWNIFPNPTNGKISIESELPVDMIISVSNYQGQELFSAQNTEQLNLNSLTNGYYIITIKTDKVYRQVIQIVK